ncbi:MAG: hypothetical protein EBS34_12150 [Flavobacteriales bacterium]|nr:hypothetical protein [Flavobacteriales bacterium]
MEDEKSTDPIAQNRQQLTQLLVNKSALKQDIAQETEMVFNELKATIKSELQALRALVPDERVRLYFKERGDYEIHAFIGSDVLVFSMHQNVFRLPDSNPLWGTGYFQHDERHGYFGVIYVYNFLAESLLQNRLSDSGYLISRIFLNKDNHFFVEGRTQLAALFRDTERQQWNPQIASLVVQICFAYVLSFDLYIPPYELQDEITVHHMHFMGESLKLQTGKRLGFKMKTDDPELM